MRKNTASRTATTFKLRTSFMSHLPEGHALFNPFSWGSDVSGAETAVETLTGNGYEHTVHAAPGLEVHAFYVRGELFIVIVFEDDTAARLHTAVRKARPVTVTYVKADGEETVRTIEPTALNLTKAGDVIVKAADRKSGEKRSFRLDRVLAYTVHRTRFTVRLEAPAPSKADLAEAFRTQRPARPVTSATGYDETRTPAWDAFMETAVRHTRKGWTGRIVPGTRAFGPSGYSVIVELDDKTLAAGGSTRAGEDELVRI